VLSGQLSLLDDEAAQRIIGGTQNARFLQELFCSGQQRARLLEPAGFLK
jgi:hypothetical protein